LIGVARKMRGAAPLLSFALMVQCPPIQAQARYFMDRQTAMLVLMHAVLVVAPGGKAGEDDDGERRTDRRGQKRRRDEDDLEDFWNSIDTNLPDPPSPLSPRPASPLLAQSSLKLTPGSPLRAPALPLLAVPSPSLLSLAWSPAQNAAADGNQSRLMAVPARPSAARPCAAIVLQPVPAAAPASVPKRTGALRVRARHKYADSSKDFIILQALRPSPAWVTLDEILHEVRSAQIIEGRLRYRLNCLLEARSIRRAWAMIEGRRVLRYCLTQAEDGQ
jgi:hypothetical protein